MSKVTWRWIMYTSQNIPGNQLFELTRETSLEDCKAAFSEFCRGVYSDDCSATLYAYSEEDWETATDFEDIGCPFDYPSKVIERGPRGGVVVSNA